ncbi:hypothetical protein SAMN05421810_104163 [Amycolatopsis arida]|uniref:Uncharacterized protein n=1 Tax=Amycolatopsis arida TaxID=587909 RepID=A0A1I5UYJ8_9PSEU|nr:hypothetical protein CLV69_106162 [Amycolatopsis arida]SFQ00311.1 hypothetical protein SAMN05421810_104163 [Amycolatopsis arida]
MTNLAKATPARGPGPVTNLGKATTCGGSGGRSPSGWGVGGFAPTKHALTAPGKPATRPANRGRER